MPGRSNSASPSVRGWSRAIRSCGTTVTGEKVFVTTGSTSAARANGTAGEGAAGAAGRPWIGLTEVTLISSSVAASCARAESTVPGTPVSTAPAASSIRPERPPRMPVDPASSRYNVSSRECYNVARLICCPFRRGRPV
ncbi:hypothetical protein M2440_002680 [Methylorubrum extorquens]|nr:hypothetical protein [Methylorubrum extorquens]